jgi:AAA+ superfamily predicted ATPase
MAQLDYIKEIAKYSLENDKDKLINAFNELIEYAKKTNKINFALQLQAIVRDTIKKENTGQNLTSLSKKISIPIEENDYFELILEKLVSEYSLNNIVVNEIIKKSFINLVREHKEFDKIKKFDLPVSNKILLYGPSGCGKTLAAYVLAGELQKTLLVINLGAIVSSKLGETSKNLSKIFKRAAIENSIIFIDEFDSIGKLRDYSQDHGEMKRVVNTILQLFDYLPEHNLLIAATNKVDMIDNALLRRFDIKLELSLPNKKQIRELINLTMKSGKFIPDNKKNITKIINSSIKLSYYTIQKALIETIKQSLLNGKEDVEKIVFDTKHWLNLIEKEKINQIK